MKKVILCLIILILLSGCSVKKAESTNQDKENDENIQEEEVKEKYVDNNPIKLSFYNKTSSSIKLVTSLDCEWEKGTDITWPNVFPTNESSLTPGTTKALWSEYWKDYVNKNYKFGLEIFYSLSNGKNIDLTVLKHSDSSPSFAYVQVYLYDGYNATTSWFDHLEDNEFTDQTVFTSIKLTASPYIDQVVSSITLRVFTYDGLDDFDETGHYQGNSYAALTVNKIN